MLFEYKTKKTFEERSNESAEVMKKHPDKIPVIVECYGKKTLTLDKTKYLVPDWFTIRDLLTTLRKRIKLNPAEAIFIFVDNEIPCVSKRISELYNQKRDEDGFLYFCISKEQTFGK